VLPCTASCREGDQSGCAGAPSGVPRSHDLHHLLDLAEQGGLYVPEEVRAAGPLTLYAVMTRYPLPQDPVTAEELGEALRLGEAVMLWATEEVAGA
jgi:hypothetical protein